MSISMMQEQQLQINANYLSFASSSDMVQKSVKISQIFFLNVILKCVLSFNVIFILKFEEEHEVAHLLQGFNKLLLQLILGN